ncbi:MAG: tRNA pseudouridine(55) synthase TruB [Aquificaceae bacterium]|nr:tRNA pseudouridine(55) synthase TruB [Aquificaceae bacterium]
MLSGLLLVDKPKGMTSMEVVEGIKRKFRVKVGHTGTLDPIATGLLLVLVGEATKFSSFFTEMKKSYRTRAKLGEITNTYDSEGQLLERRVVDVSCDEVQRALNKFRGKLLQTPPPFSAKRVGGRRAYEFARKGLSVEMEPVEVHVYRADFLRCDLPYVDLFFEVSSGTYIRSLVHDLGLELSCGAHVVELRRLSIGGFNVERAISYERLLKLQDVGGLIVPIEEAMDFLPSLNLEGKLARRIRGGAPIRLKRSFERAFVRLYEDGAFIGLGLIEGEILKPYRLMRGL